MPPPRFLGVCVAIAGGYALWALAVALWTRQGHPSAVRMAWLALLVDVVVLGVLTLLTGVATPESWTSDVFTTGFLLIPVLAATQLRLWVCTAVVVPTALVYFLAAVATREANDEPWASLLLRSLVIVGVALGCVGLSRIQRSRVRTIGRLAQARSALLAELTGLEERERRALSEHLHDGALQYVLAARSTSTTPARPVTRPRSTGWNRPSPSRRGCCARPSPSCTRRCWPARGCRRRCAISRRRPRPAAASPSTSTPTAGRRGTHRRRRAALPDGGRAAEQRGEARAGHAATVTLELAGGMARLVVADDGVGMPADAAGGALRRGHIGLASHTLRIDAAGGRFTSRQHPARHRGDGRAACPSIGGHRRRPPHRPAGRRYRRAGHGIVGTSGKHPGNQPRRAPAMSTTAFEIDNTVRPTVTIARTTAGRPCSTPPACGPAGSQRPSSPR